MKKEFWKKYLPYIVAAVVFIILTIIYAAPEAINGKVIQAGDQLSGRGMAKEAQEYNKQGHNTWWTGSMFSGMPTFQIGASKYPAPAIDIPFSKILRFGFTGTLALIIGYFIGFFILLRAFKINEWLSIVGAIAMALSSYFFIIIAAGHNAKVVALAFLPPIIGGFYLIFQKKYLWGSFFTLVYSSISLMQHPQMTFYVFMLIGVLACAELYIHIRKKRLKDLIVGLLIFGVCFGIGFGTQLTPYLVNKEYVKETMRGGHSELQKANDETNKTTGLDLDYATAWSYGIDETATLLIPGAKGYASSYDVGENSKIYNAFIQNGVSRKQAANYCKNIPTYWGEQTFTAGPVYVGAIVFFLFVLGLLIVKGPYKWALLVATIFAILLSWGRNFMPLTEFFFRYFPMYDKFRAVSSILIVAEITMPLLGFLAIKAIMDKAVSKEKVIKDIYISAGITAGLCLIALIASLFANYSSPNDAQVFDNLPEWLSSAIIAERASILQISALRSMVFALLGALIVWLYTKDKLKLGFFVSILGVLILADMWPIDKKFLNEDNYATKKQDKNYFKMLPYEEELMQDTDPNFRILNLSSNTFNESRTSYYFKSIGGYNAAKLRRYQDLIDAHISQEMNPLMSAIISHNGQLANCGADSIFPVLNMLNMKYVIVPLQENPAIAVPNPNAMGNAWFVDSVVIAQNPNEESDALNKINLHTTLVTDTQYAEFVKNYQPQHDTTAHIALTKYAPDCVEYQSSSDHDGLAVFSEIYYPYGWNAYIDGKPVKHFRANYALRALNIPAGQHQIKFEFRPQTIEKYGKYSIIFKYILYLGVIGIIALAVVQCRKPKDTPQA